MTVAITSTYARAAGNGVTTVFNFPFLVFAAGDIVVRDITDATGASATKTLTTDYSVTISATTEGGSITFVTAPAAAHTIDIRRTTPLTQPEDIVNQGRFLPELHEGSFDRLETQIQDLSRRVNSTIRQPDYEQGFAELPAASSRASKYVVFDSGGALAVIPGSNTDSFLRADLANPTTPGLGNELISYRRTPAETAASVTPTGYFIDTTDYTNVMRYVSNTIDGVNSQAAAFQSAINIARISGAAITVPAPALGGSYILDVPLDCTLSAANAAAGIGNAGFTIRGTGNVLAVTPNVTSPARCAIIAKHTGHIFDCTGSLGINFENLSIGTNVTTYPKTCFLFARYSAAGPGGSIHRINNCRVMGNFSESIVYNYGAEDDIYLECQFFNRAGTANAKVFYFTSTNIRALTSSFTAIATGTQSTLGHLIQGGAFYNKTNHANGDVAYSDTVQGLRVNSAWLACGDATGAHPRSIFYFDGTNGPSNIVRLRDLIVENTAVGATYAIALSGGASTFANWVVDGCQLLNGTNAMFADIGIAFSDLNWRGNGNSSVGGGLSLQSVTNSNIEELLMPVSIVTSTNNVIKANSTALTVTSRVGDTWIDSATRTWTPGTGALTVVGALTVNNQRFEYLGKTVKATFVMSAVTSIACAAGTAITGLPRAVTIGGGEVNVTNLTTGALIPGGSVSGSSILLPAIGATGNTLAVTATYFVA